ncbi:hypothetical protein CEXT_249941 [Caerostris extrusa]|uniref:Uncharacterized protein n=1 Tax=Caerostris extrusa TaxID=172846 RepID=A0AAV4PUI8_CAEEX|nr:hypothetical protein CEXT_249941 [Caerostris extrusa]
MNYSWTNIQSKAPYKKSARCHIFSYCLSRVPVYDYSTFRPHTHRYSVLGWNDLEDSTLAFQFQNSGLKPDKSNWRGLRKRIERGTVSGIVVNDLKFKYQAFQNNLFDVPKLMLLSHCIHSRTESILSVNNPGSAAVYLDKN